MFIATAALLLCAAPPARDVVNPEPPSKGPTVKFLQTKFIDGHRFLIFQVENPTRKPIYFLGHGGQQSYKGGERVLPLHQVRRRVGKNWAAGEPWITSARTSMKAIEPKAKVAFWVHAHDKKWEAVKAGFVWYAKAGDRKTARMVWSAEADAQEDME